MIKLERRENNGDNRRTGSINNPSSSGYFTD